MKREEGRGEGRGKTAVKKLKKNPLKDSCIPGPTASSLKLPVGLRNLGNNCYQNVVIQCLVRAAGLPKHLRTLPYPGILTSEMSLLAKDLLSSSDTTSSLTRLNHAIRKFSTLFSPSVQEDADEFLGFLMARLMTEVPSGMCEELFVCREVSEKVCLSCGCGEHDSRSEPTTVLRLPMAPGTSPTLKDCLYVYTHSPMEDFECPNCGTKDDCIRKVVFTSEPQCIIICLRRFIYEDGITYKDDRPVSCPVTLSFPDAASNRSYVLQGYIRHDGDRANTGHYVAYHKADKRWFEFDDGKVREVAPVDLDSSAAYILFYSSVDDLAEGCTEPVQAEDDTHPHGNLLSDVRSDEELVAVDEGDSDAEKSDAEDDPHPFRDTGPEMENSEEELLEADGNNYVQDEDNPLNVILYEWDGVPGAIINVHNLEQYTVTQLTRWLHCRNLRKSASKSALISQIRNHVRNKQSHILWSGVDGGHWLEIKRKKIQGKLGEEVIEEPILPAGIKVWGHFPSQDIPGGFNEGHVYHYLVETHPGITKVVGKRLIVSRTPENWKPGTEKVLKRAKALVESDYVNHVRDCKQGQRFYFVKAYIRASMELKRYFVVVTLSAVTGAVLSASCHLCMASSLDRCSHVGALLLFMADHVKKNGHAGEYIPRRKADVSLRKCS